MSALLPIVLLTVASPAQMPSYLPLDKVPPTRAIRELMVNTLESPGVQTKLGITDTQRALMGLRLSQNTLKFGLSMARESHQSEDPPNYNPMGLTLENSPAHALYPFLAEGQIAKLRRLTLKGDPLGALETDEVAFAVGLTSAQRKSMDALRLRHMKAEMNPTKPAYKAAMAAFGEIAKLGQADDNDGTDDEAVIARIDRLQKATDRMYAKLEEAVRLDAAAKHGKDPDPLTLLSAAQRRRFRELSAGTLAFGKMPTRVAAKAP